MCVGKWDEIFQVGSSSVVAQGLGLMRRADSTDSSTRCEDFQHCPFGYPRDRLDWSDRVGVAAACEKSEDTRQSDVTTCRVSCQAFFLVRSLA